MEEQEVPVASTSSLPKRESDAMSGSDTPAAGAPGEPKKKKIRVSTACESCRRRKTKCDGIKPSCAACIHSGITCEYDMGSDRRKPYTKDIVQAMQLRIDALEHELAQATTRLASHNLSITPVPTRPSTAQGNHGSEPTLAPRNTSSQDLFAGGLAINAHGELRFFGPTSSYRAVLAATRSDEPTSPSAEVARAYALTRAPLPTAAPSDPVLPLRPPAISPDMKAQILRLAFDYAFSFLDLVPEKEFYSDMQMFPTERTHYYSSFLLNVVLAIGSKYLDPNMDGFPDSVCSDPSDRRTRGDVFLNWARHIVDQEWDNPTMSTIRGLLCMAVYLGGCGQDGPSWIFEGSAQRLTEDFGLHLGLQRLSLGAGGIAEELTRARRGTFWTSFGVDVIMSMYMGRNVAFSPDEIDQQLPAVSTELDYDVPVYRSTAFLWASKLVTIGSKIMVRIFALKSGISLATRHAAVPELHLALESWYHDLPSPLRASGTDPNKAPHPHVITLNLIYHVMVIQLHRSFVTRSSGKQERESLSTDKCLLSAGHVVRLLRLQKMAKGFHCVSPYFHYPGFCAGTILALSASEDGMSASALHDADRKASALTDLNFLIEALREIGKTWPASDVSASILESLIPQQAPMVLPNTQLLSHPLDASQSLPLPPVMQQPPMMTASMPLFFPSWDLEPEADFNFDFFHSLLNPDPVGNGTDVSGLY